jgi:hypothetical protein
VEDTAHGACRARGKPSSDATEEPAETWSKNP